MLETIRMLGRKIQAKYENIISSQNLFGFSNAYSKAMEEIKEHDKRRVK